MPATAMYPPAAPTIAGGKITVDLLLKDPTRVERQVQTMVKNKFIADEIYGPGPANGGAVIYTEVTDADIELYLRGEIEDIAPGSEFPILSSATSDPKVARVVKRGGAVQFTYEDVRRDRWDVIRRGLTQLANTMIRKHDALAVGVLVSNPNVQTLAAAAGWNTTNADPSDDIVIARSMVEDRLEFGYVIDGVLMNPQQKEDLLRNKQIKDRMPRESKELNPLISGQLANLLDIPNWYTSIRVPAGTTFFLARKQIGSIHDEIAPYTRVIDDPKTESYWVMGGRVSVPAITDPLACVKVTGVRV